MKLELSTLDQDFDELHRLADIKRAAAVKVDRQALLNLLMDHSKMLAELTQRGYVIKPPSRERIKLKA